MTVKVETKDTHEKISNHNLTGAMMISMLDLPKEEEEERNNITKVDTMIDTTNSLMVHQEATTCHHMVKILTTMDLLKVTKGMDIEIAERV